MKPAEHYTHGHHESVLRSHRWRTAENSAAYLLPRLRPEDRLLDVGCGPGTISADLAGRVGEVVAFDRADEVVDAARETYSGVPNARFETGDVYAMPYADDSFDVVHAHQVLQHLIDPVAALREMRRVCRPGGIVAVRDSDYEAFAWWPDLPGLDRWLELYLSAARANRAEPAAGRRLLSWSYAAGFADVTASSSTWCFANDEDRAWWSSLWSDRVRHSALAEQWRAEGVAETELDQLSEEWLAWGEARDAWFSVLHSEVLCTA